jgi:hypothetical protein
MRSRANIYVMYVGTRDSEQPGHHCRRLVGSWSAYREKEGGRRPRQVRQLDLGFIPHPDLCLYMRAEREFSPGHLSICLPGAGNRG